jgi:hypothetical protein
MYLELSPFGYNSYFAIGIIAIELFHLKFVQQVPLIGIFPDDCIIAV